LKSFDRTLLAESHESSTNAISPASIGRSHEGDLDPLHLRDQLREQMRALGYAQVRGAEDAQVESLDATDDDLPGAFSPRLRYRGSQDTVTVRIRWIANEKTQAEETLSGSAAGTSALASML
jgi:hypothetical protein